MGPRKRVDRRSSLSLRRKGRIRILWSRCSLGDGSSRCGAGKEMAPSFGSSSLVRGPFPETGTAERFCTEATARSSPNDSSSLRRSAMRRDRRDDLLLQGIEGRLAFSGSRLPSRSEKDDMGRGSHAPRKGTGPTRILLFVCYWIENNHVWGRE